jgi:tRNA A-37 threonylcarbamoyl transferase component Bud32
MGFVQVNPRYLDLLDALDLRAPEQFLALPGIIVSGHPDRHVARTMLNSMTAFLKREHRVRWRDRVASFVAGFGFVTKSQREAMTLQAQAQLGIGCPDWIAFGEDGRGRAFLLLRALDNALELRRFLHQWRGARHQLARRLGSAIARLHATGFDHPDLYAKHVFVSADGEQVYFLDWQRSRRGPVGERQRIRDLAALDATLAAELASKKERVACLAAYLQYSEPGASGAGGFGGLATPARRLAQAIHRHTQRLLHKRHIRAARQLPSNDAQELVWLDGEALCITPDFLDELKGAVPEWLRLERIAWRDCRTERLLVPLPGGRQGLLIRSRRNQPLRWLWDEFRRRPLMTPEARQAGVLFRRQRQGQPTPRLLAFGQRRLLPWRTESFLLTETPSPAAPLPLSTGGEGGHKPDGGREP